MALAVILMFPEHKAGPIKLPLLIATARIYNFLNVEKKYYKGLFKYVSRYIILSYYNESVASLLYSRFFEPKIPCNLIKAHLLGVKKTIEPVKNNPKFFARLMVRQNPKGFFLWLAAI